MNIYEEITAHDMLDHLRKFIVKAMRDGDVCAAAQAAEEMNRIENICGVLAEERGINK